jgi:C-lobe and N-lobe beta barrels of Tf-binding protein B
MRLAILLASTMLLAACGGAGPKALGEYTPPGGGGPTTDPATGEAHSFVNPTKTTVYTAQGGSQHYEYLRGEPTITAATETTPATYAVRGQSERLYDSNSTEAGNDSLSVTYDRDDSEFALTFEDDAATVSIELLYQDPGHRTAFGGLEQPQIGVPDLTAQSVFYVEGGRTSDLVRPEPNNPYPWVLAQGADTGVSDFTTFFYQKPGTVTKYVTYAGYVRNRYTVVRPSGAPDEYRFFLDRGVLVFGEQTLRQNAPTAGTGAFTGPMLATMVFNDQIDNGQGDNYFQWIVGSANVNVDFAATTFNINMSGRVGQLFSDVNEVVVASMPEGSTFTAAGNGRFDGGLPIFRTFSGGFSSASFTRPDGSVFVMNLSDPYSSANTVDGSFYGPNGEEVGGTFRVSHGQPDTRIDILGVFTGE